MSELMPSKREIRQRVEYGALVLAQRLAVLTRKPQLNGGNAVLRNWPTKD